MITIHGISHRIYRYLGLVAIVIAGCLTMLGSGGGGDGDTNGGGTGPTACTNTQDDSQLVNNVATIINSAFFGPPQYKEILSVRNKVDGSPVSIDYMVHPAGMPKAVLVLIAGGTLNAGITGDAVTGQVDTAGTNFLVRSAHLFAAQGYTVITMDRPDDFPDDLPPVNPVGSDYDGYRTSVRHAVDISTLVNAENLDHLPVFILGTSRGAISAVAQHPLSSAISISSPVTTGNGTPVDEASIEPRVRPSTVAVPTHVMWHVNDACSVSPPADSAAIVSDFNPDAAGDAVQGGFDDPNKLRDCDANTFHGFLGIESCVVGLTTDEADSLVATLPSPQVQAAAVTDATTTDTPVDIDLSGFVTGVGAGALLYELPFNTTSLGGSVSLVGPTIVRYSPPAGISGTTDTFVYVVKEDGGGKSHNVVKVTINP